MNKNLLLLGHSLNLSLQASVLSERGTHSFLDKFRIAPPPAARNK